jgi:hypothetical protein
VAMLLVLDRPQRQKSNSLLTTRAAKECGLSGV